MMAGNEYQRLANRTMNVELTYEQQMQHALFGMCGEIGEIQSMFQKKFQGHEIDSDALMHEVGDLCWFVAEFCTAEGWELESVMKANIEKLKKRYPEGFSAERSVHREEYEHEPVKED